MSEEKFYKLSVLLMESSSRQVLPMAKGFKELGCKVTTVCESKLDLGYNTKYADIKLIIKKIDTDKEAADKWYNKIVSENHYDLIVPLSDFSAEIAARNKVKWTTENGAKVAVNDFDVFMKAFDKLQTMKICTENGIPCPATVITDDVSTVDFDKLEFPFVVKPRSECGSIGFNVVNSISQFKDAISPYSNDSILIQEYIPQNGPQYGGEIFRNKHGRYSSVIINEKPRWFPLDGGSPTINVTVHNEEIKQSCMKLLDAMNWNGYANIDFVIDQRTGVAKLIEVNGRISAGVKLNYYAGVDIARLIIENEFEDDISVYDDYKDGLKTSCLLTEILWFLKSEDRFKNKPVFLNRKNTKDVVFSLKDIKPFFAFCLSGVKKYRQAMALRKRVK